MDIAGLNEETEYGHGLPWTRSTEEVDAAAILHWNGVVKPWTCDGEGPYAEQWWVATVHSSFGADSS